MINVKELVANKVDIIFITFDSLRFDVLQNAKIPQLNAFVPHWEARHSPATFTYAAHHAFFSGFLPTPIDNPTAPRLFASAFAGSTTTQSNTFTFAESTLPKALQNLCYATCCIGGVGFFNKQAELGSVLPNLFQESYWSIEMGVTGKDSTELQVKQALQFLQQDDKPKFLFINVAATHQPTCIYHPTLQEDSKETQQAALEYAQYHIAYLLAEQQKRCKTLVILTSDHGEAFGEDGYYGHRLAHETVWTVPYTEFVLDVI